MLESRQHGGFHLLRRAGTEPGRRVHFAHATGFNATTYRELLTTIGSRTEVLAMDARGHGLSTAPASPARLRSWRHFERDLISLLETLEGPSVLAGHSMGAMVSLQVAAVRPELVSALVLTDPVMVPPSMRWKAAAMRATGFSRKIPIAAAAAKRRMDFATPEEAVENYVGKGAFKTWPRAWIEAYVEGGTRASDTGITLSCDRAWEARTFAKATCDSFRFVRAVRCPVTLITAGKGSTCNDECKEAFQVLRPDTRLIELPESTHFIPMERTVLVRDEIDRACEEAAS